MIATILEQLIVVAGAGSLLALAGTGWFLLRRRARLQEEHRQSERREAELRERYRALFDSIQDVYYRADLEGNTLEASPSCAHVLGYTREERLGQPTTNIMVHPEQRDGMFQELMRHGSVHDYELLLRRKDGRIITVSLNAHLVRDRDGKVIATEGFLRDISERKRSEEERQQLNADLERRIAERTAELRQSEERFSKAFLASPAILSILNLEDGHYLDVNESFLETFGFQREEVIGHSSLELNMWLDPSHRAATFAQLHEGKSVRNHETHYRTKRGQQRVILHSAELIHIGDLRCILAVGTDITEMKRVQAALSESQERTRLIIDTALDAVITIDTDGVIRGWNPQAESIFGWSREDALGHVLANLIIPPQHREAHRRGLARFLETGEGPVLNSRIEMTALHRTGREFPVELAITALRIAGSWIFSAFIRDITERKRAESELLRALERERELGQLKSNFVAMVSHEFRTPLGIIMSSAEILDRYLDRLSSGQRHEHLGAIHKAVQRMAGMMEEVLVLGRVEAGKMECNPAPLDLVAFCQRLTDEVHSATSRTCPIEFAHEPMPPDAQADESVLRHILTNLLTNAVKYSRPGTPVHFHLVAQDGHAVFTVEDKGVGIPEADQPWIFKAFHRGQNVGNLPGTGLGLSIVKRCVDLHNGKIKCQSRVGVGTMFVVTLPVYGKAVDIGTETGMFYRDPGM